MRKPILLSGLFIAALAVRPAAAITFNFSVYNGDSLTSAEAAGFAAAGAAWSSVLTDNVRVNVQVGFRSLGSNTLGQTSPSVVNVSGSAVKLLLAADAKSADDAAAVASLPNYAAGTNLALTTAEAKAIGLTEFGTDGVIEFSSDYSFDLARNANGGVDPGKYDFVGIAEHEIGHVLGFISSVDFGLSTRTVLDQFRYSAPSSRSVTAGQSAYFSIDGGVTDINGFSPGGSGNYQASHWLQGTGALMDPALPAGQVQNITALDKRAFDVIGYDVAQVPEPRSIALLAVGLLGVLSCRKRRVVRRGDAA